MHWDVKMYGGMYRCMGMCTDVWGKQTYGGGTGAYRCMEGCTRAYRCMGVYRCMRECTDVWEDVQIGGVQMYRDILGHNDVWGMYRHSGGVQIYWGIQMYGGCTLVRGCTDVSGVIQIPPRYTDSQTYPKHAYQLQLSTIFLIKFNCFAMYSLSLRPLLNTYVYVIGLSPRPSYIFSLDKDSM